MFKPIVGMLNLFTALLSMLRHST